MNSINFVKKSLELYFNDDESYDFIEKRISWQRAFLTTIFFSLIISILAVSLEYIYEDNFNAFIQNLISILLESVIYLPLIILVTFGIIHFCLKLLGGKEDFYDTLKFGLAISLFSTLIIAIFMSIPTKLISEKLIYIFNIIFIILFLLIFIWTLFVSVKIYSRLHLLSKIKTLFALLLPFIVMFTVTLIIFLMMFLFFGATL